MADCGKNIALSEYLRANGDAIREYSAAKLWAVKNGANTLLACSEQKTFVVSLLVNQALECHL